MSCPSAIGLMSTSIGAPAAMVEASGFIWDTSGQTVAAVPTAAAAPVATKRKSRRVCPAEDAVVTIKSPFFSQPAKHPGPRIPQPIGMLLVPATRAVAERTTCPCQNGQNRQSRIVLLAPLPIECKPAIGSVSCNALKLPVAHKFPPN